MDTRAIGVVDSGVGGLTIWQEITKQLPNESIIYLADSLHCPYGNRSPQEITTLSQGLIRFLLSKDVKLVVIACNTITVTCLDALRSEFKGIPLIGTVPVVKMAAEKTKTGHIGILSTNRTAESLYQKHLIEQFAQGLQVTNLGNDQLVPLAEKGEVRGEKLKKVLSKTLRPFQEARVDVLALGCTHFPLFREEMEKILGQTILLLDSGGAVARQVRRVLESNNALSSKRKPTYAFFTTGDESKFRQVAMNLGITINNLQRVVLNQKLIQ